MAPCRASTRLLLGLGLAAWTLGHSLASAAAEPPEQTTPADAAATCGDDPGPTGAIAASCDPAALAGELERLRTILRWASCRLTSLPIPSRDDPPPAAGDADPPPFERPAASQRIDEVLDALVAPGWREELARCPEGAS